LSERRNRWGHSIPMLSAYRTKKLTTFARLGQNTGHTQGFKKRPEKKVFFPDVYWEGRSLSRGPGPGPWTNRRRHTTGARQCATGARISDENHRAHCGNCSARTISPSPSQCDCGFHVIEFRGRTSCGGGGEARSAQECGGRWLMLKFNGAQVSRPGPRARGLVPDPYIET